MPIKRILIGVAALAVLTAAAIALFTPKHDPDELSFGAGAAASIRQEVNITDGYLYAASGAYATSSAIANIDPSKYSGTVTYYFEVVASTTAGTNATVSLVNASTGAALTSATIDGGNTYTRYRSSSFTPTAAATDYRVRVNNESIGKGIIASRVVILQSFAGTANSDATSTQTQIEIGSEVLATTSTASTPLSNTKYWTYSSDKWDGTVTAFAEVAYKTSAQIASSTTYSTAGTFTYVPVASTTAVVVEAWGAGGAGFDGSNSGGGEGGGGGAYARSTTTVSSNVTMVVGAGGSSSGAAGANTTYGSTVVVADAGEGGANAVGTAARKGTAAASTGQVKFDGGNGGAGNTTDDGGGGGGGAGGPDGAGSTGVDASATAGGDGGDGDGGAVTGAGLGGNGGACSAGTTDARGGEGGGGADQAGVGCQGGAPGAGGGGGEGGQGNGAAGKITLTAQLGFVGFALEEDDGNFGGWTLKAQIVSKGVATTTSTRTRVAFTPTEGKHYRVVASSTASNFSYDVYSAKVVVNQVNIPASLPVLTCTDQPFTFSGVNQISLTSGTPYAVVLRSTATAGFPNICGDSAGGDASNSSYLFFSSVWNAQTSDWKFAVYINSVLDASYSSGGGSTAQFCDGCGNKRVAVVFSPTATGPITSTSFNMFAASSAINGTLYAEIYNTSGGAPTGAAIATSDSVSPGAVFVSKLEPQYLLAPSPLISGTALQTFLSYFDPAEWSNAGVTYLYDIDAADNSTSVVLLRDSADATTYATVTSPDNVGTSTLDCIPSSATAWAPKATTNNGDVYGVRVLAQVSIGGSGTSNCGGGGGPVTGGPTQFYFVDTDTRAEDADVRFEN